MTWPIFALLRALAVALSLSLLAPIALASNTPPAAAVPASAPEDAPLPAAKVDVHGGVGDAPIASRLRAILVATEWFSGPEVEVREGVVFLRGRTAKESYRKWAGDLARNTEGVTAVVNKIEVPPPSPFDVGPALAALRDLWRSAIRVAPALVMSAVVAGVAWLLGSLLTRVVRRRVEGRLPNALLREVVARGAGLTFLLFGVYVALQVAGLTRLAVTVVGGTGLLGIVLGIGFRDITENFLASIFLSLQRPFQAGDLVEIAGVLGVVQRLTMRASILMTLDGNHVQIPNASVYKGTIRNFTSNPNRRLDFDVGIGYEDSIAEAQAVARRVLDAHPAVLSDPEPWVLVDHLGAAIVTLRIYFWIDGTAHSWLKVQSSVIRLVKRAYQQAGVTMPDEAREIVFPKGVPLYLDETSHAPRPTPPRQPPADEDSSIAVEAEAGLRSDEETIEAQARGARVPEEGADLLGSPRG